MVRVLNVENDAELRLSSNTILRRNIPKTLYGIKCRRTVECGLWHFGVALLDVLKKYYFDHERNESFLNLPSQKITVKRAKTEMNIC